MTLFRPIVNRSLVPVSLPKTNNNHTKISYKKRSINQTNNNNVSENNLRLMS